MTKAEMIERHGIEWYEQFKERNRQRYKQYYAENREKELQRVMAFHREHPESKHRYMKKISAVGRICARDRQRVERMGLLSEGQEVHHMKYHKDAKDASWIDDILILSHEDHVKWHTEHPEFFCMDNIV